MAKLLEMFEKGISKCHKIRLECLHQDLTIKFFKWLYNSMVQWSCGEMGVVRCVMCVEVSTEPVVVDLCFNSTVVRAFGVATAVIWSLFNLFIFII
jgi:hypothetical protein